MTLFELRKKNLTLEELARVSVHLCVINNSKLCWVTSFGQLYEYGNQAQAIQAEERYLQRELTTDTDEVDEDESNK